MKVEESVSGALLGLLGTFSTDAAGCCSTFGLEENSEDMIWVGWRGLGCACAVDWAECFRGRLGGRSSAVCVLVCEAYLV